MSDDETRWRIGLAIDIICMLVSSDKCLVLIIDTESL